jgi:hypothetical protein
MMLCVQTSFLLVADTQVQNSIGWILRASTMRLEQKIANEQSRTKRTFFVMLAGLPKLLKSWSFLIQIPL